MLSISIEVLLAGFDLDLYGRAEHRGMWWAASRLLMERRRVAAEVAEETGSEGFASVAGLDAAMTHLMLAALDVSLFVPPSRL